MSTSSVQAILSRAMSEPAYRELLLNNPEKALSSYELTADEVAKLKSMPRSDFDRWTKILPEERKSFGWANHNDDYLVLAK